MDSEIFWFRVLLAIMCVFSLSKLSYEIPPTEKTHNEHSEFFYNSEADNRTSQESSWLSVLNATHNTSTTTKTTPEVEDRLFRLNATFMTAEVFQSTYCSMHCLNDDLVSPRADDWCLLVKCFPCTCDKPLCELYGTCCPDMLSEDSDTEFDEAISTTQKPRLNSNSDVRNVHGIKDTGLACGGNGNENNLSKRSCPWNYPDGDVKTRCQDDLSIAEQDIDTFLPVTDNITGITYYNENCATCNNVYNFTLWILSLACKHYMTGYSARTPGELLRLSLESSADCSTGSNPSRTLDLNICDNVWFNKEVVDTCNVTGEWDVYDANVVKACADVSGLVNRVRMFSGITEKLYKNLFCAICNMKDYPDFDIKCEKIHKADLETDPRRLPFSVLLNFGSRGNLISDRSEAQMCSRQSDWTSPDNKCLSLQCSPGKVLTNGSCSTALSEVRGLVYHVNIRYVPSDLIEITENSHFAYLYSFNKSISEVISKLVLGFEINLSLVFSDKAFLFRSNETDEHVSKSRVSQFDFILVDGFIVGEKCYSRDHLETNFVRDLILNNVTISMDETTTLTLAPMLNPHRKQKQVNCSAFHSGRFACMSLRLLHGNYRLVSEKDKQDALKIEPHLNCPFVQFDKTEYLYGNDSTDNPESFNITVNFKNARMIFSDRAELNMVSIDDNGTLRGCLELLNTKNVISSEVINGNFVKLSLYILTLICIISSIICLTITLMTYFLFPVLRSVAGKNNIFLCASLLLAQISLLATSHVPESGHLCSILAICTHFLWLSMFCWCFTCCFHMFCIFSAKTRSIQSSTKSDMMYMIKRLVACSAIPGLIVIGVITTNLAMSGGQFIGYGNSTCFVDSQITLILTLVAPLCLILLFNFIFFSITVIKIYNVRKLQTQEFRKDDHNNLYIYIKLSSMTGIFWVLSVISEATNNDPLRFISIGLNGLQGVFIFLSYTCNRRVLRLYLKLFGLDEHLATTSTSDRSTIAKVVADLDKQGNRDDTKTVEI